jgi:hypothetical protein
MNTVFVSIVSFACLIVAVLSGKLCRKRLPEEGLDPDKKDSVKLAMGLIATMSALLLGLLVSSGKGTYDACNKEIVTMAAKTAFLDKVLEVYGPETREARIHFRQGVQEVVRNIWPENQDAKAKFSPEANTGNTIYVKLQELAPRDDTQRSTKALALTLTAELGQSIALLRVQSIPSISWPMLTVVVSWLFIIFFSFSFISPPGRTVTASLFASALSVSGAVFLILELDNPFGGVIHVSSEPMLQVLSQLAR